MTDTIKSASATVVDAVPAESATPSNPFTAEDIKIVRDSWEIVKKDMTNVGFELFERFFKAYPEYQKLFKAFADLPVDQLRGNKRLEAHAKSVLYAISQLVDNLEDVELIIEMLKRQAINHKGRKVGAEMFNNLGNVLLAMLTEVLNLDEQAQAVWAKTYAVIVQVVKETQSQSEDN